MRLVSYQNPRFDLRSRIPLDVVKSRWHAAFESGLYYKRHIELSAKIGTDQFLWCSLNAQPEIWTRDIQWTFDVPEDEKICIVDSYVWCRLLRSKHTVPVQRWKRAARALFPNDIAKQDDYELQQEAIWVEPVPEVELWSKIFINTLDDDCSVLIKYPVPDTYIVDVKEPPAGPDIAYDSTSPKG